MNSLYFFMILVLNFIYTNEALPKTDSSQLNCESQLMITDREVNKILMLFNKNVTEYKTKKTFDNEYCKPFIGWLNEAGKYKLCLKAFPSQIFSMVLSNSKNTHKTICQSEDQKKIAFRHLRCMRPTNKQEFIRVGNMITSMVNYVSRVGNLDEAIPSICCGGRSLLEKIEKILEETCDKVRRRGSGKWFTTFAYSLLSEASDLMCNGFNTIEDCKKKVPKILAKVNNAMNPDAQFNHTIFIPVIRLVNRLDRQLTLQ